MNFPTDIPGLEAELNRVLGMCEQDEQTLAHSTMPEVDKIFLSSTEKLRSQLEQLLNHAKSERAHEVINLRLEAPQLNGRLPLRVSASLLGKFNAVLEQSAWRVWDPEGNVTQINDKFVRELNLQLVEIRSGSTQLAIVGNTAPDLTGVSALETALRDVFDVLEADIDAIAERVDAIGFRAGRSLSEFLTFLKHENMVANLEWRAPDKIYQWDGRSEEITRVIDLLDEIDEPETTKESFSARVNLLSIRNRMEVKRLDTGDNIRLSYHKSLVDAIQELRLCDKGVFEVEKTVYPISASSKKRNVYRLISLDTKAKVAAHNEE